ncbi:MAG: hypothetical protein M3229_02175 [Actinomycetota bacterium]|nr:hypothetical protein [Actinomycetota bacterium]
MSVQRELPRRRREDLDLDLDAEQEVDVRRYWSAIATRWWIPLAGLAVGLALGYVLAVGGKQVYRAEATLSLGTPLTPTSNNQIPSFQTHPSVVREIVSSQSALQRAAAKAGLRVDQLRGRVSTQAIGAGARRPATGQAQLTEISVTGGNRRKTAQAANALAAIVIEDVSGYVNAKIAALERELEAQQNRIEALDRRITAFDRAVRQSGDLPPVEQLVLATQLGNLEERRAVAEENEQETTTLLALAENFEKAQVIERAVAFKTTARSKRNSMLVGGLLGLLLGALIALLWEPVARRVRD